MYLSSLGLSLSTPTWWRHPKTCPWPQSLQDTTAEVCCTSQSPGSGVYDAARIALMAYFTSSPFRRAIVLLFFIIIIYYWLLWSLQLAKTLQTTSAFHKSWWFFIWIQLYHSDPFSDYHSLLYWIDTVSSIFWEYYTNIFQALAFVNEVPILERTFLCWFSSLWVPFFK